MSWQSQEPDVISTTEARNLVKRHGQAIRTAETEEVERLQEREDLSQFQANLVTAGVPQHLATWPSELNAAVEQVLAQAESTPPEGVSQPD